MKVAIIGGGISGLATAWYLRSADIDVALFEKDDVLGGHSAGSDVHYKSNDRDEHVFVNPAFDIFTEENYPLFTEILRTLKVDYVEQEFSLNFRNVTTDSQSSSWQAKLPFSLKFSYFAQLVRPDYRKIVLTSSTIGKKAKQFMQNPDSKLSFGEFLKNAGVADQLIKTFFIPIFARPWGLKPEDMGNFPAEIVLSWIVKNKSLTPFPIKWQTIIGGAKTYVSALVEKLKSINVTFYTGVANLNIDRTTTGVNLRWDKGRKASFDQVIIATNPQKAISLLRNPESREVETLSSFRYQTNHVTVHSDTRLLPKKRSDWSYFNLCYNPINNETYNSIWFGQRKDVPVFATNYRELPFELEVDKVYKSYIFQQPIFDSNTAKSRANLNRIQGENRTWYVGSYIKGTSHHEDAVQSAFDVAQTLIRKSKFTDTSVPLNNSK